ncbi:cupin domain-containing protein [Azospirillum melinis]|uniref:Cupin domain-containing protein n=1 Tax=Azospirillum melinis TaxID=328839 RepID=A0ABX2KAX3_9PROT|nr:putative cupin superfamily protein [Azospirillum melinis]NUA98438.1 cupin domain-containing protein [Azospirillum melinis]
MPNPPVLDPATLTAETGATDYPQPFRSQVAGRHRVVLGDPLGLSNFGVNLTTLAPGASSALRHWHSRQDEFVYVVEGELTLVTDAGETLLTPGMCAGFPRGVADGHRLINRSDRPASYLEVGDRSGGDEIDYSDEDMVWRDGAYHHRDGTVWE